jgi:hypothetical protein
VVVDTARVELVKCVVMAAAVVVDEEVTVVGL